MKRDLNRLAGERFDLLVIGGGITGACITRDAAMRGLSVALIEKKDFAHATSAHNSKLIHGGLRYLRSFELGLVRESLRERRIWQRIAPHLVHPLPFLIPLYGRGWSARAALAAGLSLYDALSFDRTWLDDPAQRLPGHRWLEKGAALATEPSLDASNYAGAFEYYDAQMSSPERLALECVIDAEAHGAVVANHLSAETLLLRDARVEGARAADLFSDARFDIRARLTVIAAGPWADLFLAQALGRPVSHRLLRSKGIHLIVPAMTQTHALTVAADGGHFFVLPWRGFSLLGTTDTAFTGEPDAVGVSVRDIADFLGVINAHLPGVHLQQRGDVRHFYAGLRPLLDDGRGNTYEASRHAELVDHGRDDGVDGLFSAIGGKWTTSRHLAEQVVDRMVSKLGKTADTCKTATTAVRPSDEVSGDDVTNEVFRAMRAEMALTLEDVVMRRTGIGQLGHPGNDALTRWATFMANELGWTEARRQMEIAAVEANFRTQDAA
jgi:glycerol-3-phosphate dehydrogenase